MKPIEFNEYQTDVEVNDNGSVSGYAVVWDVVDNKKDIHRKSAYTKTLSENRNLPLLPNHNQNDPIGKVVSIETDDYGLKFTAEFASTDTAQKYRKLLAEGMISKFSMGWTALRIKRMPSGGREILEVKLFEISPVSVPVGDATMVLEVNNLAIEDTPSVLDRFYGLAKNIGDKKFKLANQAEILKLAEEYRVATQPSEDTAPAPTEEDIPEKDDATKANNDYLTKVNNDLQNYLQNGKS